MLCGRFSQRATEAVVYAPTHVNPPPTTLPPELMGLERWTSRWIELWFCLQTMVDWSCLPTQALGRQATDIPNARRRPGE
jgi:hypothetical protein